jgi:hypothetical protein
VPARLSRKDQVQFCNPTILVQESSGCPILQPVNSSFCLFPNHQMTGRRASSPGPEFTRKRASTLTTISPSKFQCYRPSHPCIITGTRDAAAGLDEAPKVAIRGKPCADASSRGNSMARPGKDRDLRTLPNKTTCGCSVAEQGAVSKSGRFIQALKLLSGAMLDVSPCICKPLQ